MQIINKNKKTLQNISIYILASLIPMVLSLVVNPLIALNMEPADYAIVGYFRSFNTLIAPLIAFYSLQYYSKRYFELSDDERLHLKAMIMQSMVYFSFLLATFSFVAIYIYTIFFNTRSKIPFYPYALLSVFAIPLTGIVSLMLTDYKMQKNSVAFFKLSVSKGAIGVVAALIFVVVFKLGALGRLTAAFIANLLFFLWCLNKNIDAFRRKFDWTIFKSMVRFTWPLTIAAMLGFFSMGYDRVFLERVGDVKELGYYVVAAQMAAYLTVFSDAVGTTFRPDLYEGIIHRNWKKVTKIVALIVGLSSFVVIGFIVAAPILVAILTAGKYTYSTKYAQVLALSQITSVLYYAVSQITIALGLTKITLINRILGSVLVVIMFSYCISKWQYMGAAWGQVLSFVVFMVGNLILIVLWKRKRIITLLQSLV